MSCGCGCCCPTPCCISSCTAPATCCNGPPLLPPFCSPSNLPKKAPTGCMTPGCPPKFASLRCRAAPCNYPNPHYDPCARICGPVSNCGSCSSACSGPCCPAICGRYFPSCCNGGYF